MAFYKDRLNFVPHNLNNSTITVNDVSKITGWDSLVVERDDEEVTVQKVADGTAIFNENPSTSGTVTIGILESDPSNAVMWALYKAKASFKFQHYDSASSEHDCHANHCRVQKAPTMNRALETAVVEWVLVATYLDMEGSSYALVTV